MRSRKRITKDEAYRRYKRDYKLKESRMRKHYGREMDTPMMGKDDFEMAFEAYKADMERYAKGIGAPKPSAQNVVDTIVSDQMYETSIRQARAYKTALEDSVDDWDSEWPGNDETGERTPITPQNIRQGKFDEPLEDIFDMIRAFREAEAKKGRSKRAIREEVSRTFFGSR